MSQTRPLFAARGLPQKDFKLPPCQVTSWTLHFSFKPLYGQRGEQGAPGDLGVWAEPRGMQSVRAPNFQKFMGVCILLQNITVSEKTEKSCF